MDHYFIFCSELVTTCYELGTVSFATKVKMVELLGFFPHPTGLGVCTPEKCTSD